MRHATTAHMRVHRPLSSLRIGLSMSSGCGRFFYRLRASVHSSRPIIAVVEADAKDRNTLHFLLSSLDADVQDFDSAESYLSARPQTLACVITDVALPGMSGLDLLRVLRAGRISPPIILLGEEADVAAAVAAMRDGAVDFIEKPHMDVSILRRVSYLLDHTHSEVVH